MDRRNFLKLFAAASTGVALAPYTPPTAIPAAATFKPLQWPDIAPILDVLIERLRVEFERESAIYDRFFKLP